MSRTFKDKNFNNDIFRRSGVGKRVKFAMKKKRKTFKNLEINNGNYLNKIMADRWDHD